MKYSSLLHRNKRKYFGHTDNSSMKTLISGFKFMLYFCNKAGFTSIEKYSSRMKKNCKGMYFIQNHKTEIHFVGTHNEKYFF